MTCKGRCSKAITLVLLLILPVSAAHAQRGSGHLNGTVVDADTGAPVAFVQVLLEEAARSTVSDEHGTFALVDVPPGIYTLKAFRIGYAPLVQTVRIAPGTTNEVRLQARPTAMSVGDVVVVADGGERQLPDAAMQLEGRRLRRQTGGTVAETLKDEPGLAMRSMGPAPARPVLRGLGGERLMVLEDGQQTGDLSGTSADHALVVDPLSAERIELIRGPAALAFGSSVLGGVVNVVRGAIPTSRPRRSSGGMVLQAQSVNSGVAGGMNLLLPLPANVAVRVDATARQAADVQTPLGSLENTGVAVLRGGFGASVLRPWGTSGMAVSQYWSRYGIPGGFVGAHPHGVDIHMERQQMELQTELNALASWIPRLEARATHSRYQHREYESNGDLGVAYGLLTYTANVTAHTNRDAAAQRGAAGLSLEHRDYAAGGFARTPPSREWTLAGFVHQDAHFGPITVQGGIRYEHRLVQPTGDQPNRRFGGLAGAATVLWHPMQTLTLGLSGVRAIRMPGIEELYSDGPHLAAYSFEVGNPALQRETGYGLELLAQYQRGRTLASAAMFNSWISGYIFPRDTGEMNHRVFLPIYRYAGEQARMWGADGRFVLPLLPSVTLEATGSYVRGTMPRLNHPIPWMPPLHGTATARYQWRSLEVGATVRGAGRQGRVGPFETPTAGYVTADVHGQYHFSAGGMLHTLTLGVNNAVDTVYRDHLSRVKSVMPEPGRNLRLLYRAYW